MTLHFEPSSFFDVVHTFDHYLCYVGLISGRLPAASQSAIGGALIERFHHPYSRVYHI